MSTDIDHVANASLAHRATYSSSENEKAGLHAAEHEDAIIELMDDHDVSTPFPLDPDAPEETHQLTVRAVFVGCVLGAIDRLYVWSSTAIFGFAILKPISKALPESGILGWLFGGPFGPKENCTVQSAATAAGGLGILFVSAVPAMYRLHLFSEFPQDDIGKLIALTCTAGFFGVFFVIPLRRYYIIHQKLTFPTPAATAYTIRSLHFGKKGEEVAKKKSWSLLISFAITFVFKVMTGYAPGVIYDWHIGWSLSRIGYTSIIGLENYGWIIEFTPAFFGAGMLSGLNASWSFLGGAVLAWGIIAPSLVSTGRAVGVQSYPDEFPEIWSYTAMSFDDASRYVNSPSPRYWLLWPGVLMMLVYSFADVVMSLVPIFAKMRKTGVSISFNGLFTRRTEISEDDEDQTPLEHRIPLSWWTTGLFLSTVMSCAILATMFHMNVGEAILALILGFIFSFIGVQSSGATDINPVSTVAKASQLIFGGIGKGSGLELKPAETLNLAAGVVSAGSAAQASDMTGDLKTGYLLGAKPRNQFIAQLCGSVVAIFLTSGLFILFTKATPCILYPDENGGTCTYGAPSVSAWAAVALAVASPNLPIPPSSGYTAIALSIFSVISVVVKHLWIPKKYWIYVPNWNAVGLAFVTPQVYYPIAMAVGSVFNYYWQKRNPAGYDMYMFAISAGLLAGEGLGGVFQALLAVIGVDGGSGYGTIIGCPAFEFCG
ncbi:oligopeptide transporter [Desarmillaria tabescens]|uniref:Oligopeptide transporter n=1 Tax=Armillaria tabescens TaxID=1929756 RepID=A0AA39NH55_ARMTA|nr:oligopeptide transporter [Desarmillaria tabescens]KAK0465543.1 oligopeptide transporter [Desarmillaria tabescens]